MDLVLHSRPSPGEEGAPNPKRMRRQHWFEGRNKACLILHCSDLETLSERRLFVSTYNIFIVDDLNADIAVEGDGFTSVSPTFQIDCGIHQLNAFCVLGGTLYMLEGCFEGVGGQSVFAIDLDPLTRETRKLVKGDPLLQKVGDMSSPKAVPVALPTPDGEKIIVFSSDNVADGGFELFEPANGSWEQLPLIPGFWNYMDLYGFIDDSHRLLVQTQPPAVYAIDLSSPDKYWEKLDVSADFYTGLTHIPPGTAESSLFEAVSGRRFCFVNLFGFYDLEELVVEGNPSSVMGYGFYPPESFGLGLCRGLTRDSAVALLNYDEGRKEIHLCHLLMEKPSFGYANSCRLAISVCRVDIESYMKNIEEEKMEGWHGISSSGLCESTTIVKAHKFTLCFDRRYNMNPIHLFFTF